MKDHATKNGKKKKGIALKASSSIQEGGDKEDLNDIEEDEDFSFFVKRFNKFLRNKGNKKRSNFKPKKKRRRFTLSSKVL